MNKQLDLAIIEAIKSIISEADYDITYSIHKAIEKNFLARDKKEITSVNIVLTRITE